MDESRRVLVWWTRIVVAVQAQLDDADPLVQVLVISGEKTLGHLVSAGTQNVSACLSSEIRRVRDVVRRLGALASGAPVFCCCEVLPGRARIADASPRSWIIGECGCCFVSERCWGGSAAAVIVECVTKKWCCL